MLQCYKASTLQLQNWFRFREKIYKVVTIAEFLLLIISISWHICTRNKHFLNLFPAYN